MGGTGVRGCAGRTIDQRNAVNPEDDPGSSRRRGSEGPGRASVMRNKNDDRARAQSTRQLAFRLLRTTMSWTVRTINAVMSADRAPGDDEQEKTYRSRGS